MCATDLFFGGGKKKQKGDFAPRFIFFFWVLVLFPDSRHVFSGKQCEESFPHGANEGEASRGGSLEEEKEEEEEEESRDGSKRPFFSSSSLLIHSPFSIPRG